MSAPAATSPPACAAETAPRHSSTAGARREARRRRASRDAPAGRPALPWLTLGLAAAAALAAIAPAALQYDRSAVAAGESWRLLTASLVHWTPRMALADLGVALALSASLELAGRRREAALGCLLGVLATAAAVEWGPERLALYRGSSGIASALFVATAIVSSRGRDPLVRGAGAALALLVPLKAAWESLSGDALAAGPLPGGVAVASLVHLAGGMAGTLAAVVARRPSRRPISRGS